MQTFTFYIRILKLKEKADCALEVLEGFTRRMLICSHFHGKSTQTSTTGPRQKGKISAWKLVLTEGESDKETLL